MRINMGLFGWLILGWIIVPTWLLFEACKGLVMLFLAIANACDRHNRRRAARKAYERDQAAQRAAYLGNQVYSPWHYPQPWNYGAPQPPQQPIPQQPQQQPQDNPNWQPHWPRRYYW